jgi:hypothetical protein
MAIIHRIGAPENDSEARAIKRLAAGTGAAAESAVAARWIVGAIANQLTGCGSPARWHVQSRGLSPRRGRQAGRGRQATLRPSSRAKVRRY